MVKPHTVAWHHIFYMMFIARPHLCWAHSPDRCPAETTEPTTAVRGRPAKQKGARAERRIRVSSGIV